MKDQKTDYVRSFGRIKGRVLSAAKKRVLDEVVPKVLYDGVPGGQVWLEIGFGGGEHLAGVASGFRDINFIGCEPFLNGVVSLAAKIEAGGLDNVRIWHGDGRKLVESLPDACLSKVFILFPDPWPKKKHHRRRIIEPGFLKELHRVMKKSSDLLIVTDHVEYGNWILAMMMDFGKFEWMVEGPDDWNLPPEGWVETRYQAKAFDAGRKPAFLSFQSHSSG